MGIGISLRHLPAVVQQIDSGPQMPSKIRLDQRLQRKVEEKKKEKGIERGEGTDVVRYS